MRHKQMRPTPRSPVRGQDCGMRSFSAFLEKGDTASLALGVARGTAARYGAREETEAGGRSR